jgi:1-deoxyxylulose-5-phosphate synthase
LRILCLSRLIHKLPCQVPLGGFRGLPLKGFFMDTKLFRGMKCRRVGNSGLWVSEIGLGTWKWGYPSYDGSRVDEHEGFKILDRTLELGIFHWDTASSYNNKSGNAERLIGRYFKSRGSRVRDMVVLATKVTLPARAEHEMEREFNPNERGSNRKYILTAVENCLKSLQTDRIDILYLHEPSLMPDGAWETPLTETWGAFEDVVDRGKAVYLAISNMNAAQIEENTAAFNSVTKSPSRELIAVQNWYNLAERRKVATEGENRMEGFEEVFLDFASKNKIGVIPFFPLASGLLSGRYRRGSLEKASGRIFDDGGNWKELFLTERNLELVENLAGIAKRKGCTMAQLSIAWLLSHDIIPSVIAGVTKMEQLEDNAGAVNVSLSADDLEELDKISRD